jgi:exodeoxyribonuclease VII small subunit
MPGMAKRNQPVPKTFEEALQELEQILADVEGGELGLEDSLARYERGNFLIHHCRGVLSSAERQIELLSKGPDGPAAVEPPATPVASATVLPAEPQGDGAA